MEELLNSLSESELQDILYTWWSFYRLSAISLELDDYFKEIAKKFPKEILTCAACMHKDYMSNDNLVNALAEGYAESFLRGVAISVGIFFSSQEEFDRELERLLQEVRMFQQKKDKFCYIDFAYENGQKLMS